MRGGIIILLVAFEAHKRGGVDADEEDEGALEEGLEGGPGGDVLCDEVLAPVTGDVLKETVRVGEADGAVEGADEGFGLLDHRGGRAPAPVLVPAAAVIRQLTEFEVGWNGWDLELHRPAACSCLIAGAVLGRPVGDDVRDRSCEFVEFVPKT